MGIARSDENKICGITGFEQWRYIR